MKVLYIHGFNGSPSGSTGTFVRKRFGKANVVAPQFDLMDHEATRAKIEEILRSDGIEIVCGHSFGGFYALEAAREGIFTVAINPCMRPSAEIPRLSEEPVPEEWVAAFREREERLYANVGEGIRRSTFAVFGKEDELFSYKDLWLRTFSTDSVRGHRDWIMVPGGHRLPNRSLKTGLLRATQFLAFERRTAGGKEPERTVVAKDLDHLKRLVLREIGRNGPKCDLNHIDVSQLTDFSYLFCTATRFDLEGVEDPKKREKIKRDGAIRASFDGDISLWDLSNAKNISGMFMESRFNGDIAAWNVSNVESMVETFMYSVFNGDISKWDVSNVVDMDWLFDGNDAFGDDISEWNVSRVKSLHSAFNDACEFDCDLGNWDVSNVEDMGITFFGSRRFVGDIGKWNVSNVRNFNGTFAWSNFDGDISNWDVSNAENMECMLCNKSFNGDISKWNVGKVTNMYQMFWESAFTGDISGWDVSSVENMDEMFYHSAFDGDISRWNVSKVGGMRGMFEGAEFNGDISNWDVSKVFDMSSMFEGAEFNGDISNWDVSHVKYMRDMFKDSAFKGDISKWNLENIEDGYGPDYPPFDRDGKRIDGKKPKAKRKR